MGCYSQVHLIFSSGFSPLLGRCSLSPSHNQLPWDLTFFLTTCSTSFVHPHPCTFSYLLCLFPYTTLTLLQFLIPRQCTPDLCSLLYRMMGGVEVMCTRAEPTLQCSLAQLLSGCPQRSDQVLYINWTQQREATSNLCSRIASGERGNRKGSLKSQMRPNKTTGELGQGPRGHKRRGTKALRSLAGEKRGKGGA